MHFVKAAALVLPLLLQTSAFVELGAVNSRRSLRIGTFLKTATNPFTNEVVDVYSSTNDPNGPNLVMSTNSESTHINQDESSTNDFIENTLSSYIGPRAILAAVAILYATNFPLGAIMNDNLPASAATSSRMVLASLALSPFLLQLKPSLRLQVLIGGAFVSLGYITQVSIMYICAFDIHNSFSRFDFLCCVSFLLS